MRYDMNTNFFEISTRSQDDYTIFADVINQGIDGHLEAFTKSDFSQSDGRAYFNFHVNELSILLRRLNELEDDGNDEAGRWADDIVSVHYGIETA